MSIPIRYTHTTPLVHDSSLQSARESRTNYSSRAVLCAAVTKVVYDETEVQSTQGTPYFIVSCQFIQTHFTAVLLVLTFFLLFAIPFVIFALLFSLPPSRNSDPGSHSRLFPLTHHYGSCLVYFTGVVCTAAAAAVVLIHEYNHEHFHYNNTSLFGTAK